MKMPVPDAVIPTERLVLRRWRAEDRGPFADMNADPRVMEHLPNCLNRAESDALADRIAAHFDRHGFGLWAVEIREGASFAGYIGLSTPTFAAPFMPCVEIGWRLAAPHWGRGYATEGARATLEYGFRQAGLAEIVSFTATCNARSWRVMQKIGMTRDPAEDFDHPVLPSGHRLRRHVLYRMQNPTGTRPAPAGPT